MNYAQQPAPAFPFFCVCVCLLFFCVLFHSVFFYILPLFCIFFLNAVRVDLGTSKERSRYVIKGKSQNPSGGLANKQMQVKQSVGTCTKFIAHTNTGRVRGEEGFSPRRVHTLCWWSCVSPGFEQSLSSFPGRGYVHGNSISRDVFAILGVPDKAALLNVHFLFFFLFLGNEVFRWLAPLPSLFFNVLSP